MSPLSVVEVLDVRANDGDRVLDAGGADGARGPFLRASRAKFVFEGAARINP